MKINRIQIIGLIGIAAALGLAGCSKTQRATMGAAMTDRPAHITCLSYGQVMIDMDTKGKIEFDSTGRIDFIDKATGDIIKTEGECFVRYKAS